MRTLRFRSTNLKFPDGCAVCLTWAHETYDFERVFIFSRRAQLLRLAVPLCFDHMRQAKKRSKAQVWCRRVSWIGGSLLGLAAAGLLFTYWLRTGQSQPWWTIPLALFTGASLGIPFWAILEFWISPLLASKETKAVMNSLRMTRYDPYRNLLDVRFQNDTYAELTARHNLAVLDMDKTGLKHYHIETRFQCDDVRLLGDIKADVLLDHQPTHQELYTVLEPESNMELVKHGGVDCPYRLFAEQIEEKKE